VEPAAAAMPKPATLRIVPLRIVARLSA